MNKLKQGIVSLYRKVATSLPPDVEEALKGAEALEDQSPAKNELQRMLGNIKHSRKETRPLCLDTGVPVFHISLPGGIKQSSVIEAVMEATREATEKIPLVPNAVNVITKENTDDNTGEGFPIIYFEETDSTHMTVELMLLGAGVEGLGRTYILPDASIKADRSMEGVRQCVMDTIERADGKGCPPYIIGVGIGTTRDRVTWLSKQQLRRKLGDTNPIESLAALELKLCDEINRTGIGPGGLGGKSTALGVKIGAHHRHTDTFFVDVTLLCWNTRRGKLIW
ncbi:fumarate hydratase [Nitrospirota bacterium]